MEIQDGDELIIALRVYAKTKGFPLWVKYYRLILIMFFFVLLSKEVFIMDEILPDTVRYDIRHNRTSLIFEKDKGGTYFNVKEIRQVVKSQKKIDW